MRRSLFLLCLSALVWLAFVACDDQTATNSSTPGAPSSTDQPTLDQNGSPPETPLISIRTAEPIETEFGRDPVTAESLSPAPVAIILAEASSPDIEGEETSFDRMTFQFSSDHPAYEVMYVPGPIQNCASGENENIAGSAFLQISFNVAVAHDDTGALTVSPTDIQSALPSIQQAKQTCDYEGVVTWVLGLAAETDFRVFTVLDQIMIIDIMHP